MTSLTAKSSASQLRLAASACDLAPHLYRTECLFHGITPIAFTDLTSEQQRIYLNRAEEVTLGNIGYLDSKARERAHRKAIVDNDVFDEFNEDACRLIEKVMHEAVSNYPDELRRVWREQSR